VVFPSCMVSELFSQVARFPLFEELFVVCLPQVYFDLPWGQNPGKKPWGTPGICQICL
jgi:hypothetical protein